MRLRSKLSGGLAPLSASDDLLGDLLRRVSRSFYLSLAILPRPLREPLGLAYLLARAADTVADTRLIARAERIGHLRTLRRAYAGDAADVAAVARAAAPRQAEAAERTLLERVEDVLARVTRLPEGDRAGVRFGKALQMTNVLRDVPGDLAHGRCYLPARELATLGLTPAALLDPAGAGRARPLLDRLLGVALEHYDAAWRYTLAIPRREWRMRLACAWPLLIGQATLEALAAHPAPLAASPPVKVERAAVRVVLARSTLTVWSNRALAAEAARRRARIVARIENPPCAARAPRAP